MSKSSVSMYSQASASGASLQLPAHLSQLQASRASTEVPSSSVGALPRSASKLLPTSTGVHSSCTSSSASTLRPTTVPPTPLLIKRRKADRKLKQDDLHEKDLPPLPDATPSLLKSTPVFPNHKSCTAELSTPVRAIHRLPFGPGGSEIRPSAGGASTPASSPLTCKGYDSRTGSVCGVSSTTGSPRGRRGRGPSPALSHKQILIEPSATRRTSINSQGTERHRGRPTPTASTETSSTSRTTSLDTTYPPTGRRVRSISCHTFAVNNRHVARPEPQDHNDIVQPQPSYILHSNANSPPVLLPNPCALVSSGLVESKPWITRFPKRGARPSTVDGAKSNLPLASTLRSARLDSAPQEGTHHTLISRIGHRVFHRFTSIAAPSPVQNSETNDSGPSQGRRDAMYIHQSTSETTLIGVDDGNRRRSRSLSENKQAFPPRSQSQTGPRSRSFSVKISVKLEIQAR
ncbi:hypothetical protein C8R43DRAFT_1006840 [Mycena crocata]|nr:hypothetical protein C8R43DRAFT_1006840 [Mycena crocata]